MWNNLLANIYKSLLFDNWDSLVINRRKPCTTRISRRLSDKFRVCCHIFDPCEEDESFGHPHPWPAMFLILKGKYKQDIGYSPNLNDKPDWHFTSIMVQGCNYVINDEFTWHKITPLERTYTIMVNGEPFANPHKEVKTTKGKDLDKLDHFEMMKVKKEFRDLINCTFNYGPLV